MAEDGAAPQLVTEHTGADGIGILNAIGTPAGPGGQFVFSVTPTLQYPYLSLATMLVESNDVFLAFGAKGIRLLDYADAPRPPADILADFNRELAVWDAGTEANEVPGVGPNQVLRQAAANSGAADPTSGVRIYNDATNDLDSVPGNDRGGEGAGGFAQITVTNDAMPGKFNVTLHNTSNTIVYPGLLTPVAWAIHSNVVQLFTSGLTVSPGLEQLAEDGDPAGLAAELSGNANVASSGVVNTPDGAAAPGPIMPGQRYSFSVMADATHRYLSIASMIVPSNDTFFAFEPAGLRIMNQDGSPRSNSAIAADIAADLIAWDAGTERNQAGAAGPDQAPRQAGPNTGADEGDGTVRLLFSTDANGLVRNDLVWDYPQIEQVLRATIEPVMDNQDDDYLFVSSSTWGRVDGIDFTDEDILAFNLTTQSWKKYFDASDVGLWWNDLDAFDLMSDGSILMSFKSRRAIAGIGAVDDSDIVRFIPTALGEQTSGSFEFYFDGSDVGLSNDVEDIDAVSRLADGRLLISTNGNFRVPGISGRDEDLILFAPDSLGANTAGDWERYFDGSDVGLHNSSEDVNGAWLNSANREIYLTTKGSFSVNGLDGSGADIFICTPASLGSNTACAFRSFWAGADYDFGNEVVDGFALGKVADSFNAPTLTATVVTATPAAVEIVDGVTSYQDPAAGQDEAHDLIEEPDLTVDNPDDEADADEIHNSDDVSQGEQTLVNKSYLPMINR